MHGRMEGEAKDPVKSGGSLGKCMSLQAMHALYELKEKGMLCDATIRLEDGAAYQVHRALLSSCSLYFRCLFTTTLHDKEKTDVLLEGVSSEILYSLLEYAYLRCVHITPENVSHLLTTADYLGMVGVLNLCTDFLKDNMNPHNVIGIMMYARDHFCQQLADEAVRYILKNFVEVSDKSEELIELNSSQIYELIGSDELNVKNEETVWNFVLKWVEKDPDERKPEIVLLIKQIRLGLMDTQFFLEKVKDHQYVVGHEACRPLIIEALKFMYDLEMITKKPGEMRTPEIARPRIPHEVLFAVGGWSGGSPTSCIETYDTRADRWVKVEEVDPAGPRAYHGTAVIGHDIYVIGGFDGVDYFNSCRCFNAISKTWREVAPMNSRRCYVSVAVVNELIYAMGGYDGHHRQNTAERYDFRNNQWSMIAPMNAQRSDASATTLNGKIYVTGGFNGQECLSTAEVYNPELNTWTMIAPMRSRRSGVSCIAYHGLIYVVGGFNGISRVCTGEKYNPENNTWTPIPDMYCPRSNFAVEVIDDMIFVLGGFNGVTTIYHVECFDDKPNEWYEATDMNVYRSALSACVISDLPNIREYIHQHRDQLMEEKRQRLLLATEMNRSNNANPRPQQPHDNHNIGQQLRQLVSDQDVNNNGNFEDLEQEDEEAM